jgi:hypothetical protein
LTNVAETCKSVLFDAQTSVRPAAMKISDWNIQVGVF